VGNGKRKKKGEWREWTRIRGEWTKRRRRHNDTKAAFALPL